MSNQMEKELEDILNMNSSESIQDAMGTELVKIDEKQLAASNNHIDSDYNYVRANMRSLIENSNNILETLIPLAQTSESPRLYEVLAQHIKTLAESNKELMQLQKDLKAVKEDKSGSNFSKSLGAGGTNIETAVFVGTSSAALDHVKDVTQEVIEGEVEDVTE